MIFYDNKLNYDNNIGPSFALSLEFETMNLRVRELKDSPLVVLFKQCDVLNYLKKFLDFPSKTVFQYVCYKESKFLRWMQIDFDNDEIGHSTRALITQSLKLGYYTFVHWMISKSIILFSFF